MHLYLYVTYTNWTLTALQRRRIETAEMKLLRPVAGYTLYDPKTNDYIRREIRITGIPDKTDEYRRNWLHTCKECHKTESLWNHTTTDHKEGEQLEDRRSVGESSCSSGDGTDRWVQSLMFMTMLQILWLLEFYNIILKWLVLILPHNCVFLYHINWISIWQWLNVTIESFNARQ